nr:marinostatin C2 [Alteromonas sp.]
QPFATMRYPSDDSE